ncbi:hypothetical protein Fmac_007233 [Flemingia macrophylla]|uniref:L-gulonolactone oxidase 2-like C-terminal domain-containing protein n=1 Tax=Flemingia macrophylla TaxID=520843 RepID=A0ABD1NEF3_9FABA
MFNDGCTPEGLCICSQDRYCAPNKGYFCRPGRIYKEARVCTRDVKKIKAGDDIQSASTLTGRNKVDSYIVGDISM